MSVEEKAKSSCEISEIRIPEYFIQICDMHEDYCLKLRHKKYINILTFFFLILRVDMSLASLGTCSTFKPVCEIIR